MELKIMKKLAGKLSSIPPFNEYFFQNLNIAFFLSTNHV